MTYQYHSMLAKENSRLKKEQMQNDRTPMKEDRRPYLRTIQDEEIYVGLVIGDQRDTSRCFNDRKSAQSAYKKQLSEDIIRKNVKHGNPVSRPDIHMEEHFSNGLIIGKDESIEKEEKRLAAKNLMERSRVDIGNIIGSKLLDFFKTRSFSLKIYITTNRYFIKS